MVSPRKRVDTFPAGLLAVEGVIKGLSPSANPWVIRILSYLMGIEKIHLDPRTESWVL
jgi:hypothetical protein